MRSGSKLLAVLAGIVLLPVALLVALAVALGLGSPILFRQVRSGQHGRPFTMLKFRTMRDLRGADGRLLDDAARTPPLGRWLRRSRLDELPELINIARGEMVFVGPRPLLPASIAALDAEGTARGAARPGLTGWAQVNGNALLNDRDKLALDLWYLRNASWRLDLTIVLRTIQVMIAGEKIAQDELERAYAGDRRRRG